MLIDIMVRTEMGRVEAEEEQILPKLKERIKHDCILECGNCLYWN